MNIQPITNSEKLGFRIEETSEATTLSKAFVRLEIKRGKLKAKKFGRRVVILREDLLDYLTNTPAKESV